MTSTGYRPRYSETAHSEGQDEDSLVCTLDSPHYHLVRFESMNRFSGMVLDSGGRIVRALRVWRDGKLVGDFPADRPSGDLSEHVPHLPAARNCRFEFDLFLGGNANVIGFEAVFEDDRVEPLFEFDLLEVRRISDKLEAMRRALDTFPMPEAETVFLTQGHRDVEAYRRSIIPAMVNAERYLETAGFAWDQIASVLDFGCGSGRMLTGWYLDDSRRAIVGCDINPLLIGWARAHLPRTMRLDRTPPLPPLPYPDRGFDLVGAVSVFTHLSYRTQKLWARELARVLRPGGALLLTLHGKPYIHLFQRGRLEEFEEIGHIEIENAAEGGNESASFHASGIVPKIFQEFEIAACFPAGRIGGERTLFPLAALQDVYVLRRADRAQGL